MQLPTTSSAFNQKSVQEILQRETKFITNLLDLVPFPVTTSQQEDDLLLDSGSTKPTSVPGNVKKSRAKSLVELQSRLQEVCSKKKLTYKEKLTRKAIKTKIKKKGKQDQRNAQLKQERLKAAEEGVLVKKEEQTTSSVTNDRMVFSKFDFSGIGKKKHKQNKFDPQKTLENLKKQKQKIRELQEEGEIDKAVTINDKVAWKNALAKAEGQKVKDDETLLVKSIKKREQQKKQSKKKWEARQEGVKKMKDDRQKKRQENIDKRKKTKKLNKLKRAAKRGKIIPGF